MMEPNYEGDDYLDEDSALDEMEVSFLGQCKGVGLSWRGSKDRHVMVSVLTEDDGHWFTEGVFSSAWLDEQIQMLEQARDYLKKNCVPVKNDGYKFKK